MRRLSFAGRSALLGVSGTASLYGLLCHIPFTWTNFIADRRYPAALEWFLRVHPLLLLAAVLAAGLPRTARGEARRGEALWWTGLHAAACLWFAARPLLPALRNDQWSLAAAFLLWEPVLSLEVLALLSPRPRDWGTALADEDRPIMLPALAASIFLFAVYSATHLLASRHIGSAPDTFLALCWSLAAHLLTGAGIGLVLAGAAEAGRMSARPGRTCLVLLHLLLAVAASYAFKTVVLASVSFSGAWAWCYSLAVGSCAALACFNARAEGTGRGDGSLLWMLAAAAGLCLAPFVFRKAFVVDWAFSLATVSVLAVWAGAMLLSFRAAAAARGLFGRLGGWIAGRWPKAWSLRSWRAPAAGLACVAAAAAGRSLLTAADPWFRRAGLRPLQTAQVLAAEEPSFRALRGLLGSPSSSSEGDFFQFLEKHTNLPRSTPVDLPEVELSSPTLAALSKPDIFVIVIDSLRSDYLGAYNPAVRFTPSFDSFARESIVFKRSFTAYGGTGLSEPSIWAGSMLPHMQYPSPFHPVNSLEKLVERQGYKPIVTVDVVLGALLARSKDRVGLDDKTTGNYKLCDTLAELEGKLADAGTGLPVFVYTQPQDIHVSVIEREGRASVSGEYPGFFSPYASRVARMDACFGRFVEHLKKTGRWDNSVVVLAADHGDSLGEGERWGHAFTVYPEVMGVPIVMHLPPALEEKYAWDADSMTLLTDITPSLYALLGLPPTLPNRFFGRSLFRVRGEPPPGPRDIQMVASSYGPVYGLLLNDGRSLYIADGAAYRQFLFRLGTGEAKGSPATLDDKDAHAHRDSIREWVGEMDRFYGLKLD